MAIARNASPMRRRYLMMVFIHFIIKNFYSPVCGGANIRRFRGLVKFRRFNG
jgi:hypothetical protein